MSYNDKFAFWKANVYDEEIRNELNKLEGDEVAKENCFFKDLSFGTAGIRGKLGAGPNCVNIYTVARAVKAYAVFLNRKKRSRLPLALTAATTRSALRRLHRAFWQTPVSRCFLRTQCSPRRFCLLRLGRSERTAELCSPRVTIPRNTTASNFITTRAVR